MDNMNMDNTEDNTKLFDYDEFQTIIKSNPKSTSSEKGPDMRYVLQKRKLNKKKREENLDVAEYEKSKLPTPSKICSNLQTSNAVQSRHKLAMDTIHRSYKQAERSKQYQDTSNSWKPHIPINITDLIENDTLEGPHSPCSQQNLIFEPAEFTGRSTTCIQSKKSPNDNYLRVGNPITNRSLQRHTMVGSPSVEQILESSCAEDVRQLSVSLRDLKMQCRESSISLPRTADISLASTNQWNEFNREQNIENMSSESFHPAEEMGYQLLEDEKAWQFEYADIPKLDYSTYSDRKEKPSEDRIEHKNNAGNPYSQRFYEELSYYVQPDSLSKFSVGEFFSGRSENVQNVREIIPNESPPQRTRPVPLIDTFSDTENQDTQLQEFLENESSKSMLQSSKFDPKPKYNEQYSLLSLTDIAEQINNLNEDSPHTLIGKLKSGNVKKTKSCMEPSATTTMGLLNNNLSEIDMLPRAKSLGNRNVCTADVINSNKKVKVLKLQNYVGKPPIVPSVENQHLHTSIIQGRDQSKSKCEEYSKQTNLLSLSPNNLHARIPESNNKTRMILSDRDFIDNCNKENQQDNDTLSFRESILEVSEYIPKTIEKKNQNKIDQPRLPDIKITDESPTQRPIAMARKRSRSTNPSTNSNKSINSPKFVEENEKKKQTDIEFQKLADVVHESGRHSPKSPSIKHPTPSSSAFSSPGFSASYNQPFEVPNVRDLDQMYQFNSAMNFARSRSVSSSPTTVTGSCSTASGFSSTNNPMIPLKSSSQSVSWGSIKLRKSSTKKITVKNDSSKRLSLRIKVTGPGFQVTGHDHSAGVIVLQAFECRTIEIRFCPTVLGAAAGELIFRMAKDTDGGNKKKWKIYLYGYGGNATIILTGFERGPNGPSYLKLGDTCDLHNVIEFKRSFFIYNRGPLNGIAIISLKSKSNDIFSNIKNIIITPNKCILKPDEKIKIQLSFRPRRDDIRKLLKKTTDVLTIATIEVIYGDEPNRQRIVSLISNSGKLDGDYKALQFLIEDLPGKEIFKREESDAVFDLFSFFRNEEIALTMNRVNFNETNESQLDFTGAGGIDETVMFRTIAAADSTILTPYDQPIRETILHPGKNYYTLQRNSGESWTVRPGRLEFDQSRRGEQNIYIRSNFRRKEQFVLDTNVPHLIEFNPATGSINPGEEIEVGVIVKPVFLASEQIYAWVRLAEEKIEVPIFII